MAIPLLVQSHSAHALVTAWWRGREVALSGHALVETYSVLTRLPGGVRLAPHDAARLMSARFAAPLNLDQRDCDQLPDVLAGSGIAGGAVYDAIVALAAKKNGCVLATRDARAKLTYDAIGVVTEIVA